MMQEENVINNMKIIRFKIRRYKNGYSQGVLVESGNKWNLININEVDYVLKKEVKKPAGAKPGFVVYYTNYSMVADTDIRGIREV